MSGPAKREPAGRRRQARGGPGQRTRRQHFLTALVLVLATFAVYAQVRDHELLIYDDPDYIILNPNLRLNFGWESVREAFRSPYLGNWSPLTSLSLRLDFELYGRSAAGYLLTNVVLHAFATLVLYAALARLTGARGRSAFVAGIFALHPLHVESVAWVSERKDVLSAAFFMLGLYAYARFAERPRLVRMLAVLLPLLLGLLSKASLVTFPFVLLLLDWWPLGRVPGSAAGTCSERVSWQRAVLEKLPMLMLVAAFAILTYVVQREAGAMESGDVIPWPARLRNALEAYVRYAGSSFWPSHLAVFYPHLRGTSPVWQSVAAALLLIGVSAWAVLRGRAQPYLVVGWLWYLGVLVPMIGLVQVGAQARADRYMYLPLIGLSIMLAWGAGDLLERVRARRLAPLAAGAVLGALWLCTWFHLRHWHDSIALFEHTLAVTPENSVPHLHLGEAYLQLGNTDAAERHFARSSMIDPQRVAPRLGLADVRVQRGDLAGALAIYEREARNHPNDVLVAGRYGFALLQAGRVAEAQRPLELAITAHPGSALLHAALAIVHGQLGRTQDAIRSNRLALRFDPGLIDAANNLAWVLATREQSSSEERQEAVALAEQATRARGGDDPNLLDTLAAAYAAAGRFDDAVAASLRAASAAEAGGHPELARESRERGALYADRRAYLDPSPRAPTRQPEAAANSQTGAN